MRTIFLSALGITLAILLTACGSSSSSGGGGGGGGGGDDDPTTFTVTFDLGEHGTRTGGGALEQTIEEGEDATAPEVEANEGWTFTGWDGEFTNVTSDLTINAVYEEDGGGDDPTTYTVTFDLGAHGTRTGGGELEQTIAEGEDATAPEVEA
ncbi:MAG: hypothetical protein EA401_09705, partial [Planctomycetota bacterium]